MTRQTTRKNEDVHTLFLRVMDARQAEEELRQALWYAQRAGSPRTIARIRLARTSAQGAVRHLEGLHTRAQDRARRTR